MALLNAAISGAILLAMALVALGVSDDMLVRQYERDLSGSLSGLFTAVSSDTSKVGVAYATNNSFTVYYEDGGRPMLAGEAVERDKAALTLAVSEARAQIEREVQNMNISVSFPASEGDILYQRILIANSDASGMGIIKAGAPQQLDAVLATDTPSVAITVKEPSDEVAAPNSSTAGATSSSGMAVPTTGEGAQSFTVAYGMPGLLVDAEGKSYRIASTVVSGSRSGMMLVLQDRADELAARSHLKWLFFGCAMGGLVLVGVASLFLSKRAVRPVEASITQQRAFVAAASHELRTPVAALRANAEVLRDADLGEYAPFLESIEQESLRMGRLVSDLTDLARADAGKLAFTDELVDAEVAAMQTIAVMRPLAERKGIALTCEVAPAAIRGDSERLRQALVAVLDNAIRYTDAGGHIAVCVMREKQRVTVSITDDGPGIPDEHKLKVFDRFYRVDPSRQEGGSGLGLSVARQIVERMKGTIEVRDGASGKGCTFEMKWKSAKL